MPGTATLEPAAARLADGLAAWRRLVVRRRCAAAVRRWLPLAVAGLAAGVAAGRFDGSLPLTVAGTGLACLAAGLVWLGRARSVPVTEAARDLDAVLGLDEQVATALWLTAAGEGGNPLAVRLVERAALLAAEARGMPGATRTTRTTGTAGHGAARRNAVPGYGGWAAAAVLAVAAAAAVAIGPPGAHPARGRLAAGQRGGRTGPRVPEAGLPSAFAGPSGAPAGAKRPAASAAGGANLASGSRASAGATRASPDGAGGGAGATPAPGASARAGRGTPAGERGGAAGASQATRGTAAGSGAGRAAASSPADARRAPGEPGGGRSSATAEPGQRAGSGQRPGASATVRDGTRGGVPGGVTAGTARGAESGGTGAVPLPDVAGGRVVLIVLAGGNSAVAVRVTPQDFGAQGEGSGGSAAGAAAGPGSAGGAAYVPPDENGVPFPDRGLLGRYF